MTLIDAHTHIFDPAQIARRREIAASDATFGELYGDPVAKMAAGPALSAAVTEAGLDGAVAAGFAFSSARELGSQNEHLLAIAKADPRIIALATVNPALQGWEAEAERALAAGARGFGELRPHNQGW
ncbi:MAG: amidohydrolase, partial [Anaerolineaceae bacterium]